ncbi:MAG: hypothetical protein K2X53_06335 [Alphaproteobacteria bacterium]|nr:hypothetical protein [Alphaproteobacteria bacterium]
MVDSKMNKENDILVFAEDDETLDVFSALNWSSLDLKPTFKKGSIKEVVDHISKNGAPQFLILDLSSSKLPISDMQKVANVCDPGINVITIGMRNDVGLFRDLMALGIRDYIAKPLTSPLLMRTLQRVVKGIDAELGVNFLNPGQSIGVIGICGGAGCSTITANIASNITKKYLKSAALVDLDLRFSGSSKLYNDSVKAGFRELLESTTPVEAIMVQRSMTEINENLHVIGGDEAIDDPVAINQQAFRDINQHLKAEFQYVFYDIAFGEMANYQPWFLNTFNTLVVVATPTIFQIRDAVRLMNHIKKHSTMGNRVILVLNFVGMHKNGEIDQAVFEKAVFHEIDEIINFDPNILLGSMNTGTPAVETKGKFSSQIDRLSRHIIGFYSDSAEAPDVKATSKLSQLFKWGKSKA